MSKKVIWKQEGENWIGRMEGKPDGDYVQLEHLAGDGDGPMWCCAWNGDCSDAHAKNLTKAKNIGARWLLGCLEPGLLP